MKRIIHPSRLAAGRALVAALLVSAALVPLATTSSADTTTTSTEATTTTTTPSLCLRPILLYGVDPTSIQAGRTTALTAHMLLARDPATPDNCGLPYTGPVSMQLVVGAQVYVGALTIDLAAPAAVAGWADGPLLIPASAPPGPATLILDFPGSDSGPIRASIVVLAPPSAAPTPVAATPSLTG